MSQRFYQQEKFKNVHLKLEDTPEMHGGSTIIKSTFSPDSQYRYRPSTPIHSSNKYNQQTNKIESELKHSYILDNHGNRHSPKAKSAYQNMIKIEFQCSREDNNNGQNNHKNLQTSNLTQVERELIEKDEIISQLKNIIKITYENNSKLKPKSAYLSEKSPELDKSREQDQKELKQLRHNVKILTIENNALSGYIDKLKEEISLRDFNSTESERPKNRTKNDVILEKQYKQSSIIQHLRDENQRLKDVVRQKESNYEKKIDQFIISHKSLANQCKRLEQYKDMMEAQNQRLSQIIEETHRKTQNRQQEKLIKTQNSDKKPINIIKQQYAQSLKQIQETVQIQVQAVFDSFRMTLKQMNRKVVNIENRIQKIQQQLRSRSYQHLYQSNSNKKSQIYIEEGVESIGSDSDVNRIKSKPFAMSRLYEQHNHKENQYEEMTRPMQQQIIRLKEIIIDLENQMSQRSEYYTFRQRQYEHSGSQLSSYRISTAQKQEQLRKTKRQKEEKERQLIEEINRLKQETDKLEHVYQQEKIINEERIEHQMNIRDDKIAELQKELYNIKFKFEKSLDQMKILVSMGRAEQQLKDEIQILKKQLQQSYLKIAQYQKLCNLLKKQTEENTVSFEIFDQMKKQIREIKQKYHQDLIKLGTLEKQNKQILIANNELKGKLEQTISMNKTLYKEKQGLSEKMIEKLKSTEELTLKLNYSQNVRRIIQDQLRNKKEMYESLLLQKNQLEKQLVNYLSIFNKLSFEEVKVTNKKHLQNQQLGLQELLNKISKLEASFNDLYSSKREKIELITKLISQQIGDVNISEIQRKRSK